MQQQLVILGGGSAGWMAAAMLAKTLGHSVAITLVESEEIGTVGVGEASIPPLTLFNRALGIDERDFMAATAATFKLGIQFEGWGNPDACYMHAFGAMGRDLALTPFVHFWLKQQARLGEQADKSDFWRYSANACAGAANRFGLSGGQGDLPHAYHFDAGLYANYLREFSQKLGVKHINGRVSKIHTDSTSGDITALELSDGTRIAGDLFIDCSGFASLLIDKTLNAGFEDWSHWLPCDSAWAVPSARGDKLRPYTRSIAHQAGWQWQIPLQHRTGNGMVFASRWWDEQDAKAALQANLETQALDEPRLLKFKVGRRRKQWHHNCVALGLASGFLEPLESTSIHLVQSGIMRLVKLFPAKGLAADALRDEYNRQSQQEFEQIRDFIILHYCLNSRDSNQSEAGSLWRHCRNMALPASLEYKIALFKESGMVVRQQDELFAEVAWQQVMLGQGVSPQSWSPMADKLTPEQLTEYLQNIQTITSGAVSKMPPHDQFIQAYCQMETA
ncbi:tryptophan 7-halogenase [Shewanella corallii]|uniref:Tryptophan 7-halogenase n=1 Tax=Shewanella corallii TaxID=560080 RepID=A0ABT0N1L6_9GAMM|nr:tryptophan halogenase family protein [Shewanella corallii]MCL2912308.1 tryptophan 7-halogenase [Shewanella corallii]